MGKSFSWAAVALIVVTSLYAHADKNSIPNMTSAQKKSCLIFTNRLMQIQLAISEAQKKDMDQAFIDGQFQRLEDLQKELAQINSELATLRRGSKTPSKFEIFMAQRKVANINKQIKFYFFENAALQKILFQDNLNLKSPVEQMSTSAQELLNLNTMTREKILEQLKEVPFLIQYLKSLAISEKDERTERVIESIQHRYNAALMSASFSHFEKINPKKFREEYDGTKSGWIEKIADMFDNFTFPVEQLIDRDFLKEHFYVDFDFNDQSVTPYDAQRRAEDIAHIYNEFAKDTSKTYYKGTFNFRSGAEESAFYIYLINRQTFRSGMPLSDIEALVAKFEQNRSSELEFINPNPKYENVGPEDIFDYKRTCSSLFDI